MNLLIVDDDLTSLKLLRAELESEGHAVFEAHDGVDALALLEHQRVDAVISDILMPRMDGYRLCHEIRKHARLHDLPIILYTSIYTSPGDEKLALDMGVDKFLKKPVSIETLVAALHEVITMPHAAPQPKSLQEVEVLKEYSERLVNKLEEKNTELVASEGKFRALVEQSIVAICIVQDDQFVYVNPEMQKILGWSEEEMTSRTVSDFIVPEDHALARENIPKRISGGVPSVRYYLRMLHQSGAVLQVEVHGSRTDYNGRPAVMGMLLDITARKQAEDEILRQTQQLRRTVEGAVLAMSLVVETRDPYTAGHERRVSELATAIATDMGMAGEQLAALRHAGLIHDIGKVAVPAEILSKPGRLSAVEFELIKQHPATGFDILASIDFGAPVAEMVLQHHERLDGSGYPRGLAGEAILPEAKILAVADVVEAMSSHRPYRAALGMEAALAEVREHAGVKYDAAVAAACVRLVEEQGFQFSA